MEEFQMWFVVPMVGDYSPVYVTCDIEDAQAVCFNLNWSMGSQTEDFVVETLYGPNDTLNFSLYRNADMMAWISA